PVVDGIPVVMRDQALANAWGLAFGEPVSQAMARAQESDVVRQALDHFSTYLDGSWGDFATPPADFGFAALAEKLGASRRRVRLALELGCGVGRGLRALSPFADAVIGLDTSGSSLRRAQAILAGQPLSYARRTAARRYLAAEIRA